MKLYVITTGTIFGLLTVAHIARLFEEGSHLARQPWFIFLIVLGAALTWWAAWLLKPSSRP